MELYDFNTGGSNSHTTKKKRKPLKSGYVYPDEFLEECLKALEPKSRKKDWSKKSREIVDSSLLIVQVFYTFVKGWKLLLESRNGLRYSVI